MLLRECGNERNHQYGYFRVIPFLLPWWFSLHGTNGVHSVFFSPSPLPLAPAAAPQAGLRAGQPPGRQLQLHERLVGDPGGHQPPQLQRLEGGGWEGAGGLEESCETGLWESSRVLGQGLGGFFRTRFWELRRVLGMSIWDPGKAKLNGRFIGACFGEVGVAGQEKG